MKNLIYGLIATLISIYASNAQVEAVEPSNSVEYYSYVLSKSNLPLAYKVNFLNQLSEEKFRLILNLFPDIKNVTLYAKGRLLYREWIKKQ